jgi:2-amino-4-hydroxy-6-hydroxymethyldihydropteridine diphosphokinase
MIAYLGLGSNLGDRQAEIATAVRALAGLGRRLAASPIYETDPEGGAAQPAYLNAAVRVETDLEPRALLEACLAIERARGRVRPADRSKAPRILDIDLLLYGAEIRREPGLRVPHPLLLSRPFVRIPLAEVALPGLRHPETGEALDHAEPDVSVRRLPPLP